MPAVIFAQGAAGSDCVRIATGQDRLECYDRFAPAAGEGPEFPARRDLPAPGGQAVSGDALTPFAQSTAVDAAETARDAADLMSRVWELDPETRRQRFQLMPHQANYLLPIRVSSRPNLFPDSPERSRSDQALPLDDMELKFQFSVKLKVAENLVGRDGDLWFGYTQQAHWQIYNDGLSKPFRELNYSPEIILSLKPDSNFLGWRWQLLNLGMLHESNGLSEPGSRSWNRFYAQFGLTHDRWMVMLRPWYELGTSDDNPDIIDYMGRGDLRMSWIGRKHTVSMLARYSFAEERGALQIDWAFPISGSLKGYLQVFSGYGESLIDYNHSQTTIGVGVLLTSWQ